MLYLRTFENFNDDRDYDSILDRMKDEHGWGDLSPTLTDNFEESEYYEDSFTEDEYVDEFDSYMYKIQTGEIDDPE